MRDRSLPLGIDIGATRLRIVHAARASNGPHVRAVAVRDIPAGTDAEYVSALIEDALSELGTRERRCIAALGEPDALLRTIRFPKMTSIERERSARLEAQRHVDFPIDEATIRIHPLRARSSAWVLGIARSVAVKSRMAALRNSKLKLVSIDHEACALTRALPGFDAILDIGHQRASLHVMTNEAPFTLQAFNGGADVTRGIERQLSIDEQSAEKRKRILGTSGAGERAREVLTGELAALVQNARHQRPISRVALVGNGSRLPGLVADLEKATGALFEIPVSETLRGGDYPEDVVRSSAPDWTLATGLSMWVRP